MGTDRIFTLSFLTSVLLNAGPATSVDHQVTFTNLPCDLDSNRNNRKFVAVLHDQTKYKQCGPAGYYWILPCAPGTVFREKHQACIPKSAFATLETLNTGPLEENLHKRPELQLAVPMSKFSEQQTIYAQPISSAYNSGNSWKLHPYDPEHATSTYTISMKPDSWNKGLTNQNPVPKSPLPKNIFVTDYQIPTHSINNYANSEHNQKHYPFGSIEEKTSMNQAKSSLSNKLPKDLLPIIHLPSGQFGLELPQNPDSENKKDNNSPLYIPIVLPPEALVSIIKPLGNSTPPPSYVNPQIPQQPPMFTSNAGDDEGRMPKAPVKLYRDCIDNGECPFQDGTIEIYCFHGTDPHMYLQCAPHHEMAGIWVTKHCPAGLIWVGDRCDIPGRPPETEVQNNAYLQPNPGPDDIHTIRPTVELPEIRPQPSHLISRPHLNPNIHYSSAEKQHVTIGNSEPQDKSYMQDINPGYRLIMSHQTPYHMLFANRNSFASSLSPSVVSPWNSIQHSQWSKERTVTKRDQEKMQEPTEGQRCNLQDGRVQLWADQYSNTDMFLMCLLPSKTTWNQTEGKWVRMRCPGRSYFDRSTNTCKLYHDE